MPQQDMPWESFQRIVDAISEDNVIVSLQGEGEPSLHPQFEQMAAYVSARGHRPYTILNGSRVNAHRLAALFPTLGISVDSLDEHFAEKTGRHNLPKVLRNVEELCEVMNPKRITIMTVDMGQPLDELRTWVKRKDFGRHIIQPLSPKSDYARHYTVNTDALQARQPLSSCRFLAQASHRFFTWKGQELPCAFMKDPVDYLSRQDARQKLGQGERMQCCHGCPQLRPLPVHRAIRVPSTTH